MPLGADIGQNIRELTKAHPNWPRRRILAAAINAAHQRSKKGK